MNYRISLYIIILMNFIIIKSGENPFRPEGGMQRSVSFLGRSSGRTLSGLSSPSTNQRQRSLSELDSPLDSTNNSIDPRLTTIQESLSKEQEELTELSTKIDKNTFDIQNLTAEYEKNIITIKNQNLKIEYLKSAILHLLRTAQFDNEKNSLINQIYLKMLPIHDARTNDSSRSAQSYYDQYLTALDAKTHEELQEILSRPVS